ncbi:MAG: glycosyltransferase [Dorea sp.]|uniref:glycosyltransferase n=1 Tax=Ruminococcus sp. TaxID=41978 RepID=UPI0039914AA9
MQISVVIPLYNQKDSLKFTLEGFNNQKTKYKFKIIIIDDGSEESSEDIIKQFYELDLKYIYQEHKGRAAARNAAIPWLNSDITIFNDCDRIPEENFVEMHVKNLKKNSICIGCPKEIYVSGNEERSKKIHHIILENNRLARELRYSKIIDVLFDENGKEISLLSWLGTFSGNLSIYTEHLKTGLWYDEKFTNWGLENLEFGYRAKQKGLELHRIRTAINYHIVHPRGKGFYEENIKINHKYFYSKYPTKEIYLLKPFMLGEISLQSYEKQISSVVSWENKTSKELYNKIL